MKGDPMKDLSTIHAPVLLDDCVNLVSPALNHKNSVVVDCTLGLAGHATAFLKSAPLATLVGIPMYADIFGTIPVAEALLAKGAQLGTILAFMMAVTTLSLPSMIMLKKAVKPKLLTLFIVICTTGIILVGYLFNVFHAFFI